MTSCLAKTIAKPSALRQIRLGWTVILVYCSLLTNHCLTNESKTYLSSQSASDARCTLSPLLCDKEQKELSCAGRVAMSKLYLFACWLALFFVPIAYQIRVQYMTELRQLRICQEIFYWTHSADLNLSQIASWSQFKSRHILKIVYCYGQKFLTGTENSEINKYIIAY
jgi:hypothetical protein